MKLSNNFTLAELIKSSTASRNGIDNTPNSEEIERLAALAQNILQPVRDHFGLTKVSSGFRCFELECALYQKKVARLRDQGGEQAVYDWFRKKSHPKGEAADFECPGYDNYEVFQWIKKNLTFDQLFLEFYKRGQPSSGWVHCSYSLGYNRKYSGFIG